ncbi:MAG: QueT transporter family protein [Oscillospiraceae bacterium]|jgi:uncharacterized membrane protein
MKKNKTHFLTVSAIIAALYCVVTLVVAPIAFGPVQFRISEVFTVLPLFSLAAVPGLTVGCLLSNLIGFMLGMNPAGLIDALFGTAATLIAATITYYIGKSSSKWLKIIFAPLPPVLLNGIIIGAELTVLSGAFSWGAFTASSISVALGELVVCYPLGVPLMLLLFKKDAKGNVLYQQIFQV